MTTATTTTPKRCSQNDQLAIISLPTFLNHAFTVKRMRNKFNNIKIEH